MGYARLHLIRHFHHQRLIITQAKQNKGNKVVHYRQFINKLANVSSRYAKEEVNQLRRPSFLAFLLLHGSTTTCFKPPYIVACIVKTTETFTPNTQTL